MSVRCVCQVLSARSVLASVSSTHASTAAHALRTAAPFGATPVTATPPTSLVTTFIPLPIQM